MVTEDADIRQPRKLAFLLVGLLLAWSMAGTVMRIVPGGPFLSVHADLIPIALCLAINALGVIWLRREAPYGRFFLLALMLAATVTLASVLENVLLFWFRPYARGVFIEW